MQLCSFCNRRSINSFDDDDDDDDYDDLDNNFLNEMTFDLNLWNCGSS